MKRLVIFTVVICSLLVLSACTSTEVVTRCPTQSFYETIHIIQIEKLGNASEYWNVDWKGHASQLYDEISAVNTLYFQTHRYIPGETDCNDMAIEVWNRLISRGIISLIVVGNLDMSQESFVDCNHTWLIVYSGEGSAAVVEATSGEIYIWEDAQVYPCLKQYWEGFIYETPSGLRADFQERW